MSFGTRGIALAMICRYEKRLPKRSLTLLLAFAICLAGWLPHGLPRVAHAGLNQWTPRGPEGGSVVDLAVDPSNTSVVYASAYIAGIFKSTDGAATWTAAAEGFGPNASYVNTLAVDPNTRTTLYAGTANDGVYTSFDAGETWSSLSAGLSGLSLNVYSLAINPSNSGILYAGTGGRSVQQYTLDITTPFISSATFDGR